MIKILYLELTGGNLMFSLKERASSTLPLEAASISIKSKAFPKLIALQESH